MELHRFVFVFVCLLVVMGMVGCSPRPGGPENTSQSGAGLVEQLTLDELTARAERILVGGVTDIASYQEGEGNIYTLVTLAVEQTIKGESMGGEVVIRLLGGEMNGLGLWVEDVPSFQLGERAVVFLKEGEGIFSVVGGFQGKFTIDNNNIVSGNVPLTIFIDQLRAILAKQ